MLSAMSSRKAKEVAEQFHAKVTRLNRTRERIEHAHRQGLLRVTDVETSYSGLFLQVVLAYETAMEDFVLGLLVKPGGIVSEDSSVRGSVNVRSYAHAHELASGPGGRFPSWIGNKDLLAIAKLLLNKGAPFVSVSSAQWHFVEQCRYIRNAVAHPSEHALSQFRRHVIQSTPLPQREQSVAGYLRGRGTSAAQTRWELFVAGLGVFVSAVAK